MKKFIAAFDGLRFSEGTMQYAVRLAKHHNAHLVGISLEDVMRHSYGYADIISYESGPLDQHLFQMDEADKEKREMSINQFEQECQKESVNYSIHRDRNVAIHELLHESVYADLLIIDGSESLTKYEEKPPARFVRDLLADVQCPVLVVPPKYTPFAKYILLYDGSPTSVRAVKAFNYLFEQPLSFAVEIVTVKRIEEDMHLPDNRLMKEFIKRHWPKAEYITLRGEAEDELIRYLQHQKKEAIIVLGAYQRGRVSRLFRPSMADYLLENIKMPLFIAHS